MEKCNSFLRKKHKRKITTFDVVIIIVMVLLSFIMIYPFWYMFAISISHTKYVSSVILLPKKASFDVYRYIFSMPKVYMGYLNSLLYSFLGLAISMILTILGAYGLAQKWLPGNRFLSIFVLITMYFSGGLIPTYLLINKLNMINTIWAMVIPGAISTYNLIITRTYFINSIPKEIVESAKIDGANDFQVLFKIYLPLSAPILATVSLFYFVASWNSWFNAYMFLDNESMYPVQLVLREALQGGGLETGLDPGQIALISERTSPKSLNYALTVAVVAPIIVMFPFFQKFFVKGVIAGSIKG